MKSYDVVGYAYDADTYCEGCLPVFADNEEVDAIFADSEWDYQPICCECQCELEGVTVLIQDSGRNYRAGYEYAAGYHD